MKKCKVIKKCLLSLMLTAAMVAGGVPQPANLVSANELNNKTPNEASIETEALTETELLTESETADAGQEETVTEEVSDTEAVEESIEEISEAETVEETTEEISEAETVTETSEEIQTETAEVETEMVEETTELSTEETESETDWDGVTTENIYEAENYKITFTLASHWNTGYNANIKIENTGDTAIENWYLSFDYDSEISNIWNAQIHEKTQNGYIIKNAGWNQDIPAGGFAEFGISGNEEFKGFPESYEINGSSLEVKTEDYTISYNIQSDWGSGFVASITVTNNTEKTLEDWILEFDFDNQISQIWDGEILSHEGSHYVIKNAGYNANIEAGQNICIGFNCNNGNANKIPYNFKLMSNTIVQDNLDESEAEPLIDIGEIYFKAIESEDDIVYNSENGLVYTKNQLLISALEGADKTIFEDIVSDIDARIVGYIELTNDYQIEFNYDISWDEMEIKMRYLESFSFVSKVSPNMIVFTQENMTTTNDAVYNMPAQELEYYNEAYEADNYWNEDLPYGYNWGLEALKIPSAWDTLGFYDNINPVKVGVIDTGFDENHKDLSFAYIFGNNNHTDKNHGTHVAGIMAAKHNNNLGISGVLTNCKLYGYANGKPSIENINSLMEYKIALAYLIGNNVKVINISQSFEEEQTVAISRGNKKAEYNALMISSDMSDYLKKLLNKGYDFIIVVGAGNANNKYYVQDSTAEWGYRECSSGEMGAAQGRILAKYTSLFSNIDDELLMKRIIVVGAMKNGQNHGGGTATPFYRYSEFSNIGDRVDVCAPGEEIVSTIYDVNSKERYELITDGYALSYGTSFATPYISALAGLIYQVNPELSAFEVKDIICNKSNGRNCCLTGDSYYLPYADLCLSEAVSKKGSNSSTSLPSGVLAGKISDTSGNPVIYAKITAYRTSVGESNLDDYYMVDDTNECGDYTLMLTQGTYSLNISCEGYLPCVVNNVEVVPNETKYLENIIMVPMPWSNMTSKVEGHIINAINGESITNATVKVLKGWYNEEALFQEFVSDKTGTIISTSTDSEGNFKLKLPMGSYTLEIIKDGYITGYFNVISSSGTSNGIQTLVLTPILSDDEYRIVLTWGESPADLDSHLVYYKDETQLMHVYYANKKGFVDGKEIAKLDYDDTSSYGPETVTITLNVGILDDGLFSYYVYDYSNGGNKNSSYLSESNAVVHVYKGNERIKTYNVPQNKRGIKWDVFAISKNGLITYNEVK